jgi:hypothetical protein
MKKLQLKIIIVNLVSLPILVNAQFNTPPPFNCGRTDFTQQKIGIGNFTTNVSVQAKLHVNSFFLAPNPATDGLHFRTDGDRTIENSWTMFTGLTAATATQKAKIFIPAFSNDFNVEASTGNFVINTFGPAAGGGTAERISVQNGSYTDANNNTIQNITKVNINWASNLGTAPYSPVIGNSAVAMLNIGSAVANPGGQRRWMNVGTFMSYSSDNMYVGLKEETGFDRKDAVINWGDNSQTSGGPDNLRFIFTRPLSVLSGPAGGLHGLETGRISPNGNWGIGNFYNNPLFTFGNPVRRLEILSDKQVANSNGNPQLRLTNFQEDPNNIGNTGRYSEFHSLQSGDMSINTYDNTQVNTATQILKQRFVGINTISPGNSLEINSQYINSTMPNGQPAAGFGPSTGWAGLRFTDLNSNSIPQVNPAAGVLSVDANGDVIYVPNSLSIGNNGISINAGVAQLGVPCTLPNGNPNLAAIIANQLTADRVIANRNQNFWFGSLNNETGGIAVGGQPNINAFCNTGNTFEISANSKNTQYGSTNASGLRFTKLTSSSPTIANTINGVNSSKILTVDGDGDVVLTDAIPVIGGTCGSSPTGLSNSYEIPLNNFNYIFSGQSAIGGNVGIGTNCTPFAKLEVRRTNISSGAGTTTGIFVENSDNALINRIGIQSNVSGSSQDAYGISTFATGSTVHNYGGKLEANGSSQYNTGVVGAAQNGSQINTGFDASVGGTGISSNYGFRSFTYSIGTQTTGFNFGLQSQTTGGAQNFGVWQQVYGTGNANYGAYTNVSGATNNYGILTSVPSGTNNWAGFFNGQTYCGGTTFPSDQLIKKNIAPITDALSIIDQLTPISFLFDTALSNSVGLYLPTAKQYGFKAQDIENILPELVVNTTKPNEYDSSGNITKASYSFKSINYNAFIGILAAGIKTQQSKIKGQDSVINSLNDRLTALENCINGLNLCGNSQAMQQNNLNNQNSSITNVELKDVQSIVLEQNVPNPFAEQTSINYFLPDEVNKAQLLFYNAQGKLIQSLELTQKGKGSVNVFASDLSNGIYTYTLVVDGKVIETKKMVKN